MPEEARVQRWLKIIVAVMGLLILFVLGTIVFTVLGKAGKKEDAPGSEAVTENVSPEIPATPFEYDVDIPAQAMVIETRVDGGTLVLRLSLPQGGEEIIILDMASGAVRGRVRLKPGS